VVAALRGAGVSVSMFIDPEIRQVEASAEIGAPYVELHTGAYAEHTRSERELELGRLIAAAQRAHELGLKVNAGHGLSFDNLESILNVPYLDTLNIGHSIVAAPCLWVSIKRCGRC
jgi:pyridoxine 5-phosphate synthase